MVGDVDRLFMGREPVVRDIYARLLEALGSFGPFREEPKKASIHLVCASGFAGVHPRKSFLYLNLRTAGPIDGPRVVKREQVSRGRWHNEVKLSSPGEVDDELLGWLRAAYDRG
ncbi:MAG: hypothetical protein AVDCRST_MAG88-298 [uncultured Thermomicrobiales bacterium]|uniref:DUF5655 domain-containing protein n=1 Tax=uncultured Thermomicrobiales bacterium TaxID=1645740 RepID=A0A6J4UCH3_9BACT|nr:MAG: hypothetical protein AVDCRST_MAG88-298 [uncultured Thermomicrobiales bacterium]